MNKILALVLVLMIMPLAGAGTVEFFSIDDCQPCENALDYILELREDYDFNIVFYNDSSVNGSDYDYYNKTANRLDIAPSWRVVPVIVSGTDYHIGFKSGDKDILLTLISKISGEEDIIDEPSTEEKKVVVELFWGVGCPHCADEKNFLMGLKDDYPELELRFYEVGENDSNRELLSARADELGFIVPGVPITVIGDWHLIGYGTDAVQGELIEKIIQKNLQDDFNETSNLTDINGEIERYDYLIELPLIGVIDTRDMGVPFSTVVIGLLDGFNPCAFFVLTMLLSFLMYARSRKRMLLIGLTFVFISALVYFIAMAAMYVGLKTVDSAVDDAFSTDNILLMIGGIIAMFIGVVNVKDFFFFKKGISFTISEDKKPKLYKRMRSLLKSQTLIELFVATIVLAFVANSYELICTAAMPFVYDNLLLAQGMDDMAAFTYIAIYCSIYVIPLLVIVLIFVKKFDGEKMDEETGETLKAISGFMMLGFGTFLLLNPSVLSNLGAIIGIVAFAVAVSLVLRFLKSRYKDVKEKDKKDEEENKTAKENDSAKKP
jgi:cytochrome c biogenesis protein CcdA/thiol-disulfide isomerase/thioredoxin